MIKKNVLITSAGVATAINVISALRKSNLYDCKIVATDMSEMSAGLYLADTWYLTPSAKDDDFFSVIEKIIFEEKIDFIFPLHSTETELFASRRSYLEATGVGINIPDPKVVNICIHKDLFHRFLEDNGFVYPLTYANVQSIQAYPVFIKLKQGSSSTGAYKINSKEELQFYCRDQEERYIIQEYVDWQELTIDCYVNKNQKLVGFVPRYRMKIKDGKSVVARTMYDQTVLDITKELLNRLNFFGACNLQVFFKNGELKIIELNPRLSAGGLPLSIEAGVNIPELMMLDYFSEVPDQLIEYNRNLTMYRYLTEVFQ